jgi:hypothetical protein
MISTQASPSQGTLQISSEKAPDGMMAIIVIKNRKTGEGRRYTISDDMVAQDSGLDQIRSVCAI